MKATVSALLVLLLLASPLAAMAAAQEATEFERDLQVDVSVGSTDRLGGGNWLKIEVGKTVFAVVYGTESNPNNVKVMVEYDRYIGAAEIYNETGELLTTRPIPVRTIMAQSFDLMVEFRDGDNDGLLHFPKSWQDLLMDTYDYPRKVLSLRQAWDLEDLVIEEDGNVTTVDFNLTATGINYTMIRPGDDPGDGLDRITLAFHIKVDRVEKTVDIPVYKVVVDENRHILSSELNRTETLTGLTVNGSFKYDHYIEGWDFAGDDSRLAMATHVIIGNHLPLDVARWARIQFDPHAETGDREIDENTTLEKPRLVTVDKMEFADEWTRVGRLRWTSDVEVDGVVSTMSFQVHRAEIITSFERLFRGVLIAGAFIYPKGEVIFHDPALEASVFIPLATDGPGGLLGPYFIQLGVAALAIVGLVLYRRYRRKSGP
jgi:hypothetical protein